MHLYSINTGYFKLDGGAMHGIVPKALWRKYNPADDNNMCTWAMRCMLIDTGKQRILVDNGIGNKQDAKFFSHFYLHGDDSLEKSLHAVGCGNDDVTDNFLTHLHFDHCGGGVRYKDGNPQATELTFKKATYWTNQRHLQWALKPNAREKGSFLQENIVPMQESGQLSFVDLAAPKAQLFEGIEVIPVNGHTEKQMLLKIRYRQYTVLFCADLIPSLAHIRLPWVTSYDVRPLMTLTEKEELLNEAADNNYVLFFEHDATHECCTVKKTARGVAVDETFPLSALG